MPALADLQADVRQALLTGETARLEPLLSGGRDAGQRLVIHRRHYEASLAGSLLGRFPATVWLVGSEFVHHAARQFVRRHPPTRPCIAEYGETFPTFLAAQPGASDVPYLGPFAELEWRLGCLSLAVDVPAARAADLSALGAGALTTARFALQPGVEWLHARWAIDELMSLYLSDQAPDRFRLDEGDVWLELRGCRGELRMNRLGHADFVFRTALSAGRTLGDASMSALEADEAFDPGLALLALVDERLVATISSAGIGRTT